MSVIDGMSDNEKQQLLWQLQCEMNGHKPDHEVHTVASRIPEYVLCNCMRVKWVPQVTE